MISEQLSLFSKDTNVINLKIYDFIYIYISHILVLVLWKQEKGKLYQSVKDEWVSVKEPCLNVIKERF